MTGAFGLIGRTTLSIAQDLATSEAELIDRVVELVLALEPLEHKQHEVVDAADPGEPGERAEAGPLPLVAQSTQRMLAQMRAVLDREAGRLGADSTEGKAAVDQVALIARTLEKIDQMERQIAEDQARATARTLSADQREQLRQTVRQLILAAAERLAAERLAEASEGGGPALDAMADQVGSEPGAHLSESFAARTRGCWIPAQGRDDGVEGPEL